MLTHITCDEKPITITCMTTEKVGLIVVTKTLLSRDLMLSMKGTVTWITVLCSRVRHFTLTVPLSTQMHIRVQVNLMLGGNPAMDWHPIQGE